MSKFFDRRLLGEAQAHRSGLALTVGLGALGGAATVGAAFALSRAVDGAFLGGLDLAGVQPWLLALAGFAVLRALAIWAGEVAANRVALRVKAALRSRLMAHILALGPAFTRGERTGELTNTAVEGVEALDAYFSQYLPQLALAAIVPLTLVAFVLPRDPLSAVVLILTAPLIPVFMALIGSAADVLAQRQWGALSRLSAHFLDILQGLTTLKLFNRSREQVAVIRQVTNQHRDATLRVLRVAFLSALVLEMVGTLSTAIIAVEIGLRLLYGKMLFRDALFVLILAPEFYLPLRLLGTRFHAGIAGVSAARRIFEVLAIKAPEKPRELEEAQETRGAGGAAVAFRDVHFTYPGREAPALAGVSFEIRPGEKVALVGPSGAGKSTIAQLLLGFIRPAAGQVVFTAGGAPDLPAPRAAWVPQAPYLFNAPVADNIRLGRPDAPLEDVAAAAEAAEADTFIRALPAGYETIIGERGARLSGGQAQRIALARAFLAGAPLVILDEATANLDLPTEAAVQAGLARLLAGRSALIIAHRLPTVRAADRIIVLDAGRIVEQGTHDALMARGGMYAQLVGETQSGLEAVRQHPSESADSSPTATDRLKPRFHENAPRITHHAPRSTQYAIRSIRPLLRFLAPHWRWAALSVLLGFLTIGSSIGLLAASAWIIAMAALQPSIAVLQVAIVGVRFFGIARGVFRYLERWVSHQVTFRLLAELRVWFYRTLEPLAPARLDGQRSGDLLSRAVSDIGALEQFYIRAVAPPCVAILVTALAALIVGSYDRSLAPPLLAGLLLAGVVTPLLVQRLSRAPGQQLAERRAGLSAALVDTIQGTADLLAFGAGAAQQGRIGGLSRGLAQAQAQMAAINGLGAALGSLLTWLTAAAVLAAAIPLVTTGQVAGVSLAVLALVTIASFEAALLLAPASQALETSLAAARRLFDLVSPGASSTSEPPASEGAALPAPKTAVQDLRVHGLTLRYAEDEPPALTDLSFQAPAGSRVAIIGASGAGKSTLIAALLRFRDIEAGEVWWGQQNLAALPPETVRSQISVVAQQTHLFNMTVRDNLALARPGATQAELEAAARAAQVHAVIAALPQGYDTWIGEQGWQLSGGERQRLALARAILKDAPLLILDEPAANLDPETGRALFEALEPLTAGRTTIVITHQLEYIRGADQILVLEGGRLAAAGRHSDLIAHSDLYRRLWRRHSELLAPQRATQIP